MEKEFVPYELALKLKELGFDEPCIMYYDNDDYINIGTDDDYWGDYTGFIKWNSMPNSPWKPFKPLTSAPLWQQAFDWLFKEFNFWQYTFPNAHNKDWCYHIQWYKESFGWGESFIQNGFKTQEEARLKCLEKLIELCEKN